MNRRIRLASLWVATCLTTPGLAADLYRKAPPVAYPDWSGVYVGLEAGHGWGNDKFDSLSSLGGVGGAGDIANTFSGYSSALPTGFAGPGVGPFDKINQQGRLLGGFAGAQKQSGNWVFGVEADFDGADIKGSQTATARVFTETEGSRTETLTQQHTLNTKIDELGTLRGKIGWAWSPNWMFYGTGGLAWAHARDDFSASQTFCDFRGICRPDLFESVSSVIGGVSSSSGVSMLGWTVGAGLDYKWQLDQGSAVIFGVEYLHYQFGEHSLAFGGPLCVCRDDTTFTISAICSASTELGKEGRKGGAIPLLSVRRRGMNPWRPRPMTRSIQLPSPVATSLIC